MPGRENLQNLADRLDPESIAMPLIVGNQFDFDVERQGVKCAEEAVFRYKIESALGQPRRGSPCPQRVGYCCSAAEVDGQLCCA